MFLQFNRRSQRPSVSSKVLSIQIFIGQNVPENNLDFGKD